MFLNQVLHQGQKFRHRYEKGLSSKVLTTQEVCMKMVMVMLLQRCVKSLEVNRKVHHDLRGGFNVFFYLKHIFDREMYFKILLCSLSKQKDNLPLYINSSVLVRVL